MSWCMTAAATAFGGWEEEVERTHIKVVILGEGDQYYSDVRRLFYKTHKSSLSLGILPGFHLLAGWYPTTAYDHTLRHDDDDGA